MKSYKIGQNNFKLSITVHWAITYDIKTNRCKYVYEKYIIHTVYLLHVSATHVAIFREVHYKEYIHRNITDFLEPMHRYKILSFKDNARFKIHIRA
jgi:hypothetical protein